MKLIELVDTIQRTDLGNRNRQPPRPPRGEGEGPRGGVYWLRDAQLVPINPIANEIVFPSGQTVLLQPERFGLTSEEIMQVLAQHGSGEYSAAEAYQTYLNGTDYDLSRIALLHKASRIGYIMMLKNGWAWVYYRPPEAIHLVMIPSVMKQQMAAAAEKFALMQIDKIVVTKVTNFDLLDRHPGQSKNESLVFSKEDFKNFAGPFGGVMDWTQGAEAPAHNYFYFLTPIPTRGLAASVKNVNTDKGYRKRWGITFLAKPPPPEGNLVPARVPVTKAYNNMNSNKHWLRGVTPVSRNGTMTMYSDRPFNINQRDIEIQVDGTWQPAVSP